MTYATAADLLEMYGAREVAAISRPDHIRTRVADDLLRQAVAGDDLSAWSSEERQAVAACLARIDRVLADAHRTVNSYLSSRYSMPIAASVAADSPLRGMCGDIARHLLQDDKATGQTRERYEAALQWLRDVAAGRAGLLQEATPPAGASPGSPLWMVGRRFFGDL